MRITDGCEFDSPKPESSNHFNGLIALHRASGTVICDDAFSVSKDPNSIAKLFGAKGNQVKFFLTFRSQAIDKTPTAPKQFYDCWVKLVDNWVLDNLSSAGWKRRLDWLSRMALSGKFFGTFATDGSAICSTGGLRPPYSIDA
ncbi:hypothetical protein BDR26DRAFT_955330 [Obelidium mucronatum]|nr:hypothetical protein BDR26DRAFT_955330 [Obelidium mucronatum]